MSARFGRAKRRQARQALAAMTSDRDAARSLLASERRAHNACRQELADVVRAVSEVGTSGCAALPCQETAVEDDRYALEIAAMKRGRSWDDAFESRRFVLERLRIDTVREGLGSMLKVRAAIHGKRSQVFVTKEALTLSRVRDELARDLALRMIEGLATEVSK